jgi:hypothetical protein
VQVPRALWQPPLTQTHGQSASVVHGRSEQPTASVVTPGPQDRCGPQAVPSLHGISSQTAERTTGDELADENDPPAPPPSRAPVACGTAMCGPDQYCEVRCTCCGSRVPIHPIHRRTHLLSPLEARCSDPSAASDPGCTERTVHIPARDVSPQKATRWTRLGGADRRRAAPGLDRDAQAPASRGSVGGALQGSSAVVLFADDGGGASCRRSRQWALAARAVGGAWRGRPRGVDLGRAPLRLGSGRRRTRGAGFVASAGASPGWWPGRGSGGRRAAAAN